MSEQNMEEITDIEIRLTNAVTGSKHSFELVAEITPTVVHKIDERDKLIKRYAHLAESNGNVQGLLTKITTLGMEILSCMLEPVDLPVDYDNKYELIKNCVTNGNVVSEVIRFFFESLNERTSDASASGKQPGMEIIRKNDSSQ